VNIVGNIILLPLYGIKAAAVMTVISEAIQGIFYFYFVRKNITDFNFWSLLYKPFVAAAIMGSALWFIKNGNLLISLALGAAIYFAALVISGFISKDDLKFIKGFSPNS
jgi:O-antigen/teichoic acid export membrane protein